jgi:hypothetical protein
MPRRTDVFDSRGTERHYYQIKWPQSGSVTTTSEMVAPPKPAPDCGHYCQRFGRRFESVQYVGMVDNPRLPTYTGKCPANINNIEYSYDAATVPEFKTVSVCCRCRQAASWFGTGLGPQDFPLWAYNGQKVLEKPDPSTLYRSLVKIPLVQGRSTAFVAAWQKHKKDIPSVDSMHIGWHAGLRRPTFRDDSYNASSRQGLDSYGVCSGPIPSRHNLCRCCRAILPTIPAHLFWEARGWSPDQAAAISAWELKCWTPGKSSDRINLGVLDIMEHLPW